jgi:excisionase family DNA binding protein
MSTPTSPGDDELQDVLTVDEAAAILRIGRSLGYELANKYLLSGGSVGMPAYRLGSSIRVPRWALMVLAKTGRVVGLNEENLSTLSERHAA